MIAVLDNIRSLYNVGSMFRTADAFGVKHLYLCGMTGRPDDPLTRDRLHKTALGAELTVPWTYVAAVTEAVDRVKADGFLVLALEQTPTATSLFDLKAESPASPAGGSNLEAVALVVGHEVYGVSERALAAVDHHIHIPMLGQKESLNVSVAFGIAVSWLRYQA